METIQRQAEEVVLKRDTQIINELFAELDAAKHRRDACGCQNCINHVESVELMLSQALDLITPGQLLPNT